MATQKAVEEKIIEGPSKFDLMTSLFYGNYKCRVRVSFGIMSKIGEKTAWVFIDSIEREDGSGESWNIKGTVSSIVYSDKSTSCSSHGSRKFEMYYRSGSGSRGGWIKILSD